MNRVPLIIVGTPGMEMPGLKALILLMKDGKIF